MKLFSHFFILLLLTALPDMTWGQPTPSAVPLTIDLPPQMVLETNGPLTLQVTLTNTTDQELSTNVDYVIQQESFLYSEVPPRPFYGVDVAHNAESWADMGDGKRLVESNDIWGRSNCTVPGINSMTDGKPWTVFGTEWKNRDLWTEAFGYIDLGKTYHVTHMTYDPGTFSLSPQKLDLDSSLDGKTYMPIEGLKGIDIPSKPDLIEINLPQPGDARFIRMRINNDGGPPAHAFRFPDEFHVYAGINDATWIFPQVGASILENKLSQNVPAKGSSKITLGDGRPLKPGAYLIAVKTKAADVTQMAYGHLFVMPPAMAAISPQSRFGINASDAKSLPMIVREGNGSIHYDKLLWPAVSPAPGVYQFKEQDATLKAFHEAGLPVVAELALTPAYLDPPDTKKDGDITPPTDLSKFGEFIFQAVARYGSQKQSDGLLTSDKTSGLGYVDTYELWNQPNASNLTVNKWKGSLDDYYKMFRIGAEAAKKADPGAKVANGGWWGLDIPLLETMRTFKYDDGKTPLDFTDVLNINYFSTLGDHGSPYAIEPEITSTYDISHHHEGMPFDRFFEDDLRSLVAWRDKNKPGLPIWFTQVGFDCSLVSLDERVQACWVPRGLMTILAAGVERVQLMRDRKNRSDRFIPSGVMRDDGSLKPAWFTYATLIRQLDGATTAQRIPSDDDNVRIYLWKRGDKPVLTAWSIKYGSTGQLKIPLGKCTLTDAFGASQSTDIAQPLQLTEFPIYITDFADPAVVKNLEGQGAAYADKQKKEIERLSGLRAYLFKFGRNESTRVKENDATISIGTLRDFTLVSGADLYDDAKGYGFTAATPDASQPYFQNPITITMTHLNPNSSFKFKAAPGDYMLKVCSRDGKTLTIGGLPGGDQTLNLKYGIASLPVKVGDQPVTLTAPTSAGLVWMSLVQADAESK